MDTTTTDPPAKSRLVEVEAGTGRKPRSVDRLRDWEYLERQMHRLICGWGRFFHEWDDIVAVHRHVWDQAECVRRLRERLLQFPGKESNLDQPVSRKLEDLVNVVLHAPTHEDAVEGVYGLLSKALTRSYALYAEAAHPVHDAPTLALIGEVLTIKEGFRLWLRNYRRRFDHTIDPEYARQVDAALQDCGELLGPLPPTPDDPAQPAGLRTGFRLPRWPARPAGVKPRANFRPYITADFRTSVETRRLFWAFGYMMEMNLAMDQLRWLWDGHFMPWEFQHDVSRHLWDESRHGDSGHSRLLDFGITLQQIGFGSYDPEEPFDDRPPLVPQSGQDEPGALPASGEAEPLSPQELYEKVFHIGMIAETGHFQVKRESYEDFKAGQDYESAEMMLFDIIDEQTHVQYAHRWLPVLAEHAGVDHSGYRERAAKVRSEAQQRKYEEEEQARGLSRDPGEPGYALYVELLEKMRQKLPLTNADDREPRTMLPM